MIGDHPVLLGRACLSPSHDAVRTRAVDARCHEFLPGDRTSPSLAPGPGPSVQCALNPPIVGQGTLNDRTNPAHAVPSSAAEPADFIRTVESVSIRRVSLCSIFSPARP